MNYISLVSTRGLWLEIRAMDLLPVVSLHSGDLN